MVEKLVGTGRAPGSCGELVQGLVNGQAILVSCPINIYSCITVTLARNLPRRSCYSKIDKALDLYLNKKCLPHLGWKIERQSPLIPGKGMASSTADIAAVLTAAANALNTHIDGHEIADIAIQVEPSDGIMLSDIHLFDYISGATREPIGKALPMQLVIIDPGGQVDTLKFNQQTSLHYLNKLKEKKVRQALDLVTRGIKENDLEMLGRGATISALANQHILPKPELPLVLKTAKELRAVGVVIAHSGTVMGLMFSEDMDMAEALTYIRQKNPHWMVRTAQFINGGVDRGEYKGADT